MSELTGKAPKVVLLDADGVLWTGMQVIEGAAEFIKRCRAAGIRPIMVSNNSVSNRQRYIDKCSNLGLDLRSEDFFTSMLVSGPYLKHHHSGQRILLCASQSMIDDVRSYLPADTAREWMQRAGIGKSEGLSAFIHELSEASYDVLMLGSDGEMDYRSIALCSAVIGKGAKFYATNPDYGFPTETGVWLPDTGAYADKLGRLTGVEAEFLGKPSLHLIEEIEIATGISRSGMVMVGDRMETDMALAKNAGIPGFLVLTGVSTDATVAKHDPHELQGVTVCADLPAVAEKLGI